MKKTLGSFRPGPAGACEASLFEFTSHDVGLDAGASRLIAAASLLEAVAYLAGVTPAYRAATVTNRGLIVLLSGSALHE